MGDGVQDVEVENLAVLDIEIMTLIIGINKEDIQTRDTIQAEVG